MLSCSNAFDVQDIFQHHFTGEEQQALLRLLPKADQQAACAGHNPLASTHLKAGHTHTSTQATTDASLFDMTALALHDLLSAASVSVSLV